jgi:protein required for attachment to host cells
MRMLLPHGAVVAVIDGAKLELHLNTGDEARPELVGMAAPNLDQHNKGSGARHISSSVNPGHLLTEDAHLAAVADWLNQQAISGQIKHLVVVAPPRALGELRRHYDKHLVGIVRGEIHKELIGRSGAELLAALRVK